MIALIDIGISNISSVTNAFARIGTDVTLTDDPEIVVTADGIILPGIGAFGDGMNNLKTKGLVEPIRKASLSGTPTLGFCLGMQLMGGSSDEYGDHSGLGLIPSRMVKLKPSPSEPVPNIGWCDISTTAKSRLFSEELQLASYYCVHSYHMICEEPKDVAATMIFGGEEVTMAVERGNLFGFQFHPEKSQDAGLDVLKSFVNIIQGFRA